MFPVVFQVVAVVTNTGTRVLLGCIVMVFQMVAMIAQEVAGWFLQCSRWLLGSVADLNSDCKAKPLFKNIIVCLLANETKVSNEMKRL